MCQMVSALSWQNFLIIATDTQYLCSNVATFSSWESCRACYADSDVHMRREVAVKVEALLHVCHFLPISLQNSHIHASAQDTKGFLETSKALNSNLKVCKCSFRCIVDKRNLWDISALDFICSRSMCGYQFELLCLPFSLSFIIVLTSPLFP